MIPTKPEDIAAKRSEAFERWAATTPWIKSGKKYKQLYMNSAQLKCEVCDKPLTVHPHQGGSLRVHANGDKYVPPFAIP